MATAQDVIEGAMRLLNVLSPDTTATADELADGLSALNEMLDSWSLEPLAIYKVTEDSFTTVAGTNPHTWGTTGSPTWTSARPNEILQATVTVGGVERPMDQIGYDDYAALRLKTLQTTVTQYFYNDKSYPKTNIYLWPVPSSALTVKFWSRKPLDQYALLSDTVSLPPGYLRALRFNLAVELAPEYQVAPGDDILAIAQRSLNNIKRENTVLPTTEFDQAILPWSGPGRYSIYRDGSR